MRSKLNTTPKSSGAPLTSTGSTTGSVVGINNLSTTALAPATVISPPPSSSSSSTTSTPFSQQFPPLSSLPTLQSYNAQRQQQGSNNNKQPSPASVGHGGKGAGTRAPNPISQTSALQGNFQIFSSGAVGLDDPNNNNNSINRGQQQQQRTTNQSSSSSSSTPTLTSPTGMKVVSGGDGNNNNNGSSGAAGFSSRAAIGIIGGGGGGTSGVGVGVGGSVGAFGLGVIGGNKNSSASSMSHNPLLGSLLSAGGVGSGFFGPVAASPTSPHDQLAVVGGHLAPIASSHDLGTPPSLLASNNNKNTINNSSHFSPTLGGGGRGASANSSFGHHPSFGQQSVHIGGGGGGGISSEGGTTLHVLDMGLALGSILASSEFTTTCSPHAPLAKNNTNGERPATDATTANSELIGVGGGVSLGLGLGLGEGDHRKEGVLSRGGGGVGSPTSDEDSSGNLFSPTGMLSAGLDDLGFDLGLALGLGGEDGGGNGAAVGVAVPIRSDSHDVFDGHTRNVMLSGLHPLTTSRAAAATGGGGAALRNTDVGAPRGAGAGGSSSSRELLNHIGANPVGLGLGGECSGGGSDFDAHLNQALDTNTTNDSYQIRRKERAGGWYFAPQLPPLSNTVQRCIDKGIIATDGSVLGADGVALDSLNSPSIEEEEADPLLLRMRFSIEIPLLPSSSTVQFPSYDTSTPQQYVLLGGEAENNHSSNPANSTALGGVPANANRDNSGVSGSGGAGALHSGKGQLMESAASSMSNPFAVPPIPFAERTQSSSAILTTESLKVLGSLARALKAAREVGINWRELMDVSATSTATSKNNNNTSSTSGTQDGVMVSDLPTATGEKLAQMLTEHSIRNPNIFAATTARICQSPKRLSLVPLITEEHHRLRVKEMVVTRILKAFTNPEEVPVPNTFPCHANAEGTAAHHRSHIDAPNNNTNTNNTNHNNPTIMDGAGSDAINTSVTRALLAIETELDGDAEVGPDEFVHGISYGAQMLAALAQHDLMPIDGIIKVVEQRMRTASASGEKEGVKSAVAVLGLLAEKLHKNDAFLKAVSHLQPLLRRESAADPSLDYENAYITRTLGWNLPGPRLRLIKRFPQAHSKAIISSTYFSVTDDLVTGGYEGTVAVWGAPNYTGCPAAKFSLPPSYAPAAMDGFTRGRILAVACVAPAPNAPMIRLYQCPDSDKNATQWKLVETIERDDSTVITCLKRINLKTNAFVTAEYDGVKSHNLSCYNMQGKVQRQITGAHTDFTTVLQPSADYSWLISGSRDTTVKVWDSRNFSTNAPLHVLSGHTDTITGICATTDHIITSALDGRVMLWDIKRLKRPIAERQFAAPVLKVVVCGAKRPVIAVSTTQSLTLLSFSNLIVEDVVGNTSYTDLRSNHDGSILFATGASGCDMFVTDPKS